MHRFLSIRPKKRRPESIAIGCGNRTYEKKWLRRCGEGRRKDPYRYRLPNEDDKYYDRGKLPPLPELRPLFGTRE